MARRNGRKGDYLFTDYYSGCTTYASRVRKDYWSDWTAEKILERNIQELASPLNDPYPVPKYSGPMYEQTAACDFETTPFYIGKTTRPFPTNTFIVNALGLEPKGIGDAEVGCTFVVR